MQYGLPSVRSSSPPPPLAASAYPRKKKQGVLWTPTTFSKPSSSPSVDLPCEQHDPTLPDLGAFPSLFAFFQSELAALSSPTPSRPLSPTNLAPSKSHRHLLRDSTSRQNILALGSGGPSSLTPDREQPKERLGRRKRQKSSKKAGRVTTEDEEGLEVDWKVLSSVTPKEDNILSDSPTLVVQPEDDLSPLLHPTTPIKLKPSTLHYPLLPSPPLSPVRSASPSLPSSLRRLATKLIDSFPHDELSIALQVLAEETLAETGDYELPSTSCLYPLESLDLDPPMNPENGVHIFIDHSNILVGLLSHLAQHSSPSPTHQRRTLSTVPNLSLLLQRGRPLLAPPSLVASSPLWQNLTAEKERGWDVCVLKRVRVDLEGEALGFGEGVMSTTSGGSGSSEESDEGGLGGGLFASEKYKGRVRNHAGAMRSLKPKKSPYVKKGGSMKEQGVDELLQLKILQTLLSHPPSTLVLATGDAAGSTLNATGFLGCVRQALVLGWDVEVWGWKSGMSGGWRSLERERRGAQLEGEGRFWVGELDPLTEELEGEEGW